MKFIFELTSFCLDGISKFPFVVCCGFCFWIFPFFESTWFQNVLSSAGIVLVRGHPWPDHLLFQGLLDHFFHVAFENSLRLGRPFAIRAKIIFRKTSSLDEKRKMLRTNQGLAVRRTGFGDPTKNRNLPQIIIFLQNILERVNPFYPNAMFWFFLQVIFFDNFTFGVFGFFLAPFQINWSNLGNVVVLLKLFFSIGRGENSKDLWSN